MEIQVLELYIKTKMYMYASGIQCSPEALMFLYCSDVFVLF